MAVILVTTVLKALSNIPDDQFMNNWVFTTPTGAYTQAEVDAVLTDIEAFYNVAEPTTANKVTDFLSNEISRAAGGAEHMVYDITGFLDGTPHGSPTFRKVWTLGASNAPAAVNLPSEVAVVLSFNASYAGDAEFLGATRPRARDRGRVYIGPLNVNSDEADPETRARPFIGLRNTLAGRAEVLMNASGHAWSVWSRVNAAVEPVVGGWVDNAFDIQRRRGPEPTSRILFP
jgi:hypothetical protein